MALSRSCHYHFVYLPTVCVCVWMCWWCGCTPIDTTQLAKEILTKVYPILPLLCFSKNFEAKPVTTCARNLGHRPKLKVRDKTENAVHDPTTRFRLAFSSPTDSIGKWPFVSWMMILPSKKIEKVRQQVTIIYLPDEEFFVVRFGHYFERIDWFLVCVCVIVRVERVWPPFFPYPSVASYPEMSKDQLGLSSAPPLPPLHELRKSFCWWGTTNHADTYGMGYSSFHQVSRLWLMETLYRHDSILPATGHFPAAFLNRLFSSCSTKTTKKQLSNKSLLSVCANALATRLLTFSRSKRFQQRMKFFWKRKRTWISDWRRGRDTAFPFSTCRVMNERFRLLPISGFV